MFSKTSRLTIKNSLLDVNILLVLAIVNMYVWLICSSVVLKQIVQIANLPDYQLYIVWTASFLGAVISIFWGAFFTSKLYDRKPFLLMWTFLGAAVSLIPSFVAKFSFNEVLIISILFNVSFGLGLPAVMAEFSNNTTFENRAKLGGVTWLLVMILGVLMMVLIGGNLVINSLVLAFWRIASLVAVSFYKSSVKKVNVSFMDVIKDRPFILYLVPWTMFSLVNYLSASVGVNFFGKDFVNVLTLVSNFLTGVFAVLGGLVSNIIGRKRTTIIGFVLFGFGYALLGIYPQNTIAWYVYAVFDGIAWGILYVIFLFVIWGELASNRSSEKYYALGSLPYLFSTYLRLTIGLLIAAHVSFYAIFSFAAFFLFLAVVPLMFAPETLPERVIHERELRSYIERAKRIREKFTSH